MAETVFNEGSINGTDFRIESDDNANMFFVDGADDRIGIGTATWTVAIIGTIIGFFARTQLAIIFF